MLEVVLSDGDGELMVLTRAGRAIRFPESDVPLMGRGAQGVKGVDLRADDWVVGMLVIRRDAHVLTVTDDGMGKRTPVSEFPLQKRGGLGNLAIPAGREARPVVGALEVLEIDDVMLVTAAGQVARVAASRIPVLGRGTRGGRLIRLSAGDRVVEVTRAALRPGSERQPVPSDAGGRDQSDLFG